MRHGNCCHNYELPTNIIQAIENLAAYTSKEATDTTEELSSDVNQASTVQVGSNITIRKSE